MELDSAFLELLGQLLGGGLVLEGDQLGQHLDDRHLTPEPLERRGELAPDDAAAENDDPARHLRLREQASRVDAAIRVDSVDGGPERRRARRHDRALERAVLAAVDRERVGVLEAASALDPLDAVGLEERRDAAGQLLDDALLPLLRSREVELRRADHDAELLEGLVCLFERKSRLYPRLGRDAADAQACASELRLLLDTDDTRAELGRPDRSRIAP